MLRLRSLLELLPRVVAPPSARLPANAIWGEKNANALLIHARGKKTKKQSSSKQGSQGGKGRSGMAGAVANPAMKATVDKHFDLFMRSYAPAEIEKETLTAEQLEEYEARAKEYSKMKMAQHRAWQKDITDKIRHKRAAVAALPEGYLRTAAEQEDHALFPLKRQTPMMTPPIEGFYEEKQRKAEEAVSGEGRMGGGGRR
jgi:hypothetical protein